MSISIQKEIFSTEDVILKMRESNSSIGAVVTFTGFVRDFYDNKEGKKLDKALRVCGDIEARCSWFSDYIMEGLDGPKLWQKESQSNSLGAPPEQVIKCTLMSKLGLSESEVLNRPFSLSLWDATTLAEMDGALRIYTQADAELQKQADELNRQMQDGEFNPDNIRNN